MDPIAPVAGRFISAVRRRILVVRIAESIAVSMAVASAAGLALLPILWWRGQSALPLAEVMLGAGCFFGLIWGISRRPSRLRAAIEADTQLGLHDLLGTVILLDQSHSVLAWQTTIAAFADDHCRSLSPSAIIVNRIGLRGWAGVGILSALLLSFALLTARPANVTAASSLTGFVPADSLAPIVTTSDMHNSSTPPARPPGPGGTDSNSVRSFQQDQPDDVAIGSTTGQSSNGTNASIGGGASMTRNPITPPPESPGTVAGRAKQAGAIATGAGQSDSQISVSGKNDSTKASGTAGKNAPPWNSATWPADTTAANGAINSGQVPEQDADLVRDYFRRD